MAELAIINERLAGNQSLAARKRIEWLKVRRKEWEQIYNYITKQDAAVSLALIEEANRQVGFTQAHNFVSLSLEPECACVASPNCVL